MKKGFLLILLMSFFGVSLAQDTTTSGLATDNYVQPGETKIVTQDLNSDNIAELQSVQARFCNDDKITKDLVLDMRPGQRKEVCVILANQSNTGIAVSFGFSQGILKNGAPACDADMTNNNDFSRYILGNTTTDILVPATGTIIQKYVYVAPKTASGNMLGCIGYKVSKQELIKPGSMFLIVPRKVGYIYMNITGSVYNLGRRDDVKMVCTTNKAGIMKIITAILAVWLIVTVVQTSKKKEKHHAKK